jgi:hypothetical protein
MLYLFTYIRIGRAAAQVVSIWFLTVEAQVESQRVLCEICGRRAALGRGFLHKLRVSLANYNCTSSPYLSIIRVCSSRLIWGRRFKELSFILLVKLSTFVQAHMQFIAMCSVLMVLEYRNTYIFTQHKQSVLTYLKGQRPFWEVNSYSASK